MNIQLHLIFLCLSNAIHTFNTHTHTHTDIYFSNVKKRWELGIIYVLA